MSTLQMKETIIDYWKHCKKRAILNVKIARFFFFIIFAYLVLNTVVNSMASPLAAIIPCVLYLPGLYFIIKSLSKDFRTLDSDAFSKRIDIANFNEELKRLVQEIQQTFGIEERVEYYVTVNNFNYSPHVFRKADTNYVVLPLGFFKILRQDPSEAKAILAHELSHIAQKDTSLTLLLKVFLKYAFIVLLPLQFLILSFAIYYGYSSSLEAEQEAKSYRASIFSKSIEIKHGLEGIERSSEQAEQSRALFLRSLIVLSVFVLFYAYLRKIIYNSEKTADLGAAALTNATVIQSVIRRISEDRKFVAPTSIWFTVNPSIRWRLKKAGLIVKKFA